MIVLIIKLIIILLIIKWVDDKFLNRDIAFNFKIYLNYFLVSLVSMVVIPLFCMFDRGDCVNSQRISVVLRQFNHVAGVQWLVKGVERMRDRRGCIIVVNHQSSLDIFGLFWIWRYFDRMAAVAKKEVFYAWPFGLSAYLAGVVFIDRGNSAKARKQLEDAAKVMHKDGTKLLLFPEGTRNKKRNISEFKKGAFHMAVACQVPVMPIVISPYYFINHRTRFFGSGPAIIEALPMIPTEGLTSEDVPKLTQHVHDVMSQHYEKLAQEVKPYYAPDYPGL